MKEKSLYERLGGHDAIAAIVTDYISRMRADPAFTRYSTSRGADKKWKDLQLNIDYMCKITGGSNYYMGRDMKTTHAGLGITEARVADKHAIHGSSIRQVQNPAEGEGRSPVTS